MREAPLERGSILNCMLITGLIVFLLFCMQNEAFPKIISNFDLSAHKTVFHLNSVFLKCALVQRIWQFFWRVFTYVFVFARQDCMQYLSTVLQILFADNDL